MVRTKRDIDRKWAKTAGKNGSDKCLMQGCYKLSIKKKKELCAKSNKMSYACILLSLSKCDIHIWKCFSELQLLLKL